MSTRHIRKTEIDLDWNWVRALLATAEAGTLSAAARVLGLTQPTLSRQIAALETALGVTLFDRIGKRLHLTAAASELLVHARAMDGAATALSLAAAGRSHSLHGEVSISASDAYAAYMLPDLMPRIRKAYPGITVSIIASNSFSDLRRREADIAIRHARPVEAELIGKLLYDTEAHYYASKSWVKLHGLPRRLDEIAAHEWLGFEDVGIYASHLRGEGFAVWPESFRVTSASSIVLWEMVKRGLGVAPMLREIATKSAGVVRLLPELPPVRVPVWLVTHRELRTSARIRVIFDLLADALRVP